MPAEAEAIGLRAIRTQPNADNARDASDDCHSPLIQQTIALLEMPPPSPPPPLPPPTLGDDSDNELIDQEITSMFNKDKALLVPNKSQVLFFLTSATVLRIRRTGAELQITDSSDFPLFDVWIETSCCRCTLVFESYGRTVLLIGDDEQRSSLCSLRRKPHPPCMIVSDWNADIFAYFVPGDPFLVQNSERKTIAKIINCDSTGTGRESWQCILESTGAEIARVEDLTTVYFRRGLGFQLKLLTLAAFARLASFPPSNTSALVSFFNCCA